MAGDDAAAAAAAAAEGPARAGARPLRHTRSRSLRALAGAATRRLSDGHSAPSTASDDASSQQGSASRKTAVPFNLRFLLGRADDGSNAAAAAAAPEHDLRSGVNDLISKKIRRAQLRDGPIRLDAHEAESAYVLRPDIRPRRWWDMYILVLLVYVATVSVFVFSFLGILTVSSPWFWVERFLDLSFFVDIILNFYTAYDRAGVLVTDRKAIRTHYAKTWLVPDILATFPWDLLVLHLQDDDPSRPHIAQLPRYIRMVRLFKLVRPARMLRLKQGFTQLEVKLRIKYGYIRLVALFLSVVLMAHWFACLFFYFGSIAGFEASWLTQDGLPEDMFGQYIAALYFSVYTITTIGYGDVVPENTLERTFTTIIMFLGAAMFAYIISQVSNIAGELNESSAHQRRVMDTLTDFVTYRQIPDDLVYDIRRYFQREHLRQRIADEKQLLDSINRDLRIKVLKHMYGTHLEHSRLFRDIPSSHLDDVYDSLVERFARKDEKLYSEGDEPNCFYIILKGTVQVHEGGVGVEDKEDKDMFGDENLLFNRPRESAAVCTSYTDLIVVPREAVMAALERHPVQLNDRRDEEALLLWNKAMQVVEQQIRYQRIAKELRRRGDEHMQLRGMQTGAAAAAGAGADGGDEAQMPGPSPLLRSIPRRSLSVPVGTRDGGGDALFALQARGSDEEAERAERAGAERGRDDDDDNETLRKKLKAKAEQVRKLESKLVHLQRQVDTILKSIRDVA